MVWGEGLRGQTFRHDSRGSAEAEAQRLANEHPGIRFVVLESRVGFKVLPPIPPIERTDFFELPF